LEKLSSVPYEETKYLVKKFFQKVIDLKELEQKKQLEISELQVNNLKIEKLFKLFSSPILNILQRFNWTSRIALLSS
jgi:hypothetical protein